MKLVIVKDSSLVSSDGLVIGPRTIETLYGEVVKALLKGEIEIVLVAASTEQVVGE